MNSWRLIISNPADAYTNMAIDEAIFQAYKYGKVLPTLRIYSWSNKSISLGIRQNPESVLNLGFCKETGIDYVRRMSAGEAILHAQELTYSLVCQKSDLALGDSIKTSFKIITSFIINIYKNLGINAEFAEACENYVHGAESDFCFATREKFDIVVDNKKIGGNAQKREKNFIFQHGSIPLTLDLAQIKSVFKNKLPELSDEITALSDVLRAEISFDKLQNYLIESFKAVFSVELEKQELTDFEKSAVSDLVLTKYGTQSWNDNRRISLRRINDGVSA